MNHSNGIYYSQYFRIDLCEDNEGPHIASKIVVLLDENMEQPKVDLEKRVLRSGYFCQYVFLEMYCVYRMVWTLSSLIIPMSKGKITRKSIRYLHVNVINSVDECNYTKINRVYKTDTGFILERQYFSCNKMHSLYINDI